MSAAKKSVLLERRAKLANLRQRLQAPVGAILGYSEILREDAASANLQEVLGDLERVVIASGNLSRLVDKMLEGGFAEDTPKNPDDGTLEQRLRHDLRTPLNAIKGYSEMLLEDLEDLGAQKLERDLRAMLGEADDLLIQIDRLVGFSQKEPSGTTAQPQGAEEAAEMFSKLASSLQPIADTEARLVGKGRILVVDDLESNRDLLSRRLVREGHQVTAVESGAKALKIMQVEDFDLVLLDLMMPEMNGFEVLVRLKADPRLYGVPVVMISALDEMDSVVRCIEAGAEDYLTKPFNPILLKARITACLEKAQWRAREQVYLDRLEDEKDKVERLLLNILPRQIVGRLNSGETIIADRFDNVSILFSDLVDFTRVSSEMPPAEMVRYLNALFSEFDAIAHDLKVEKIKMIGDAYMVASGVPESREDHAEAIAAMALQMIGVVERANQLSGNPFQVRIGIHSGPVVAGIIGSFRFLYDVWGDTVNVASRLETNSLPNRIQISSKTAALLRGRFETEPRGTITVKGKGRLRTYFLNAAK